VVTGRLAIMLVAPLSVCPHAVLLALLIASIAAAAAAAAWKRCSLFYYNENLNWRRMY